MDPERRALVEEIFLDALERPEGERSTFIEERCAGDPELQVEVVGLLEAHGASGLLDRPGATPPRIPEAEHVGTTRPPERIGPYRVLRRLGEGGMGVVYEAEQSEPVRRRVALKIIKLGMDTEQVVARFEAERQALAVMDHPNIARVLDAGATDAGRPYFVMELVPGIPIQRYCDIHQLPTEKRLELFVEVCRAVQHAHQKGVIHRDLKPTNVLVVEHDGRPQPKVIDFGIAKAVGRRLTERTLVTHAGQVIGTPAYMSPEQAGFTGLDVDTRTDVYSLGVMLYELLVGALPFDLRRVADAAIGHVLWEEDPPTPSSRLRTLPGDTRDTIARSRGADPRGLARELRGDLDWIVLKAIDRNRNRRYETVSGLAQDIERYLNDEPVSARRPSATYRMRKFVKRHRTSLAATAAVALALVAGTLAATVGMVRARRAEAAAEREAATAREVSSFLVDLFEVSDPGEARGNQVTAREILDQGAERIGRELGDQPEVRARLMHLMGEVYQKLGLYGESGELLEGALETRRSLFPDPSPELAESLNQLGELRYLQGRYDEAEALFEDAIRMRRALPDGEGPGLAVSLNDLANLRYQQGDLDEAERLFREVLELRRRLEGDTAQAVAQGANNLGVVLMRKGDLAGAEEQLRAALAGWRAALGDDHPSVASAMNNLGQVLFQQGKTEEAEALFRDVLERRRALYEGPHPDVGTSLNNLAMVLRSRGSRAEAEPLMREALAVERAVGGDDHPRVAMAEKNLAALLVDEGRYEEAERLYLEALRIFRARLGDGHPQVSSTRAGLVDLYEAWGRPAEAEPYREPGRGPSTGG